MFEVRIDFSVNELRVILRTATIEPATGYPAVSFRSGILNKTIEDHYNSKYNLLSYLTDSKQ
jgi:hypothetical protein